MPESAWSRATQPSRSEAAGLEAMLSNVLEDALRRTGAQRAAVHLADRGSIVGQRSGDEWRFGTEDDASSGGGTRSTGRRSGGVVETFRPRALVAPIVYQDEQLGEIEWLQGGGSENVGDSFLERLARELAFRIQRHEVGRSMREHLGQELRLVGTSRALRRLEEGIECVARSDLPVIIVGEFGVEKLLVACSIHFSGAHRTGPFVEVNCRIPRGDASPEAWFGEARDGTLFFNGIEHLDRKLQQRLPAVLGSQVGQWLNTTAAAGDAGSVRMVTSAVETVDEKVDCGELSRALFAELNFLRLRIPPLRERREDISLLAAESLKRHRRNPDQRLGGDALALLEGYDWPDNLFELERVVARLAAMSGAGPIGGDEVRLHAPEVVRGRSGSSAVDLPASMAADAGRAEEESNAVAEESLPGEEAARWLLAGDLEFLVELHPGLQRALRHISENFAESISMGELAKVSYISASHLSFLFRSGLGISFKSLLAAVRIERAKELLTTRPETRITDICLEVGFGDLSHFEKTFKRMVGSNPRDYRHQALTVEGDASNAMA